MVVGAERGESGEVDADLASVILRGDHLGVGTALDRASAVHCAILESVRSVVGGHLEDDLVVPVDLSVDAGLERDAEAVIQGLSCDGDVGKPFLDVVHAVHGNASTPQDSGNVCEGFSLGQSDSNIASLLRQRTRNHTSGINSIGLRRREQWGSGHQASQQSSHASPKK